MKSKIKEFNKRLFAIITVLLLITSMFSVIGTVFASTSMSANGLKENDILSNKNGLKALPNEPIDPMPMDGATGVSTNPTLSVNVTDPDGDSMNVTFYDASDDSMIGMDENVSSGERAHFNWTGLSVNTTYQWYVIANDTTSENMSTTWSFTTNIPPHMPMDPMPMDGATGVYRNPTLSVNISDPDGDHLNVTFYDASDDSMIGMDTEVMSGERAHVNWTSLAANTTYEWYAIANDSSSENMSTTWSFKTNIPPNMPMNPHPMDGETNTSVSPLLHVEVSDLDGDMMDVTFYNASDDSMIGTDTNISSGSIASFRWYGLATNMTYQWYAVANDTELETKSDTWSFNTSNMENLPPDAPTNPSPPHNDTGVILSPTLTVEVTDPDGDMMNITFYDGSDDSMIGMAHNVSNGEIAHFNWTGLSVNTMYHWYAVANDSALESTSATWSFTTNIPPHMPMDPMPMDGATGVSKNPTLGVNVSDPDGDIMHVMFYDGSDDSMIGIVHNVSSGGRAHVNWTNLDPNTTYEWYAVANDTISENTSATWSFTTEMIENRPPNEPDNPHPMDGAMNISTSPTLQVDVSDPDGDMMTVTFYNASDDSMIGMDTNVSSGESASVIWSSLAANMTYEWYAVANDSALENMSITWSFATGMMENVPPDRPSNPHPMDGAVNVSTSPLLIVNVSDPDGDMMNVTFYDASDDSMINTDTDVSSGSTAHIRWHGLTTNTTYSWYAVANDSVLERKSNTWSFTTSSMDNLPPIEPMNPNPANEETDIGLSPSLSVEVSDPDGDHLNVTFYNASDDSVIGTATNVESAGIALVNWTGLTVNTTYSWYAVSNDSKLEALSDTWSFTTLVNDPPNEPMDPSPEDSAVNVSKSPLLSVVITDPDEDMMDVTFYNASDDSVIDVYNMLPSGNTASVAWTGLAGNTTYSWYVVANDSMFETRSPTWSFTTIMNEPPNQPMNPSPGDGMVDVSTSPSLSVDVSDPDGDMMDVTFYDASDDSMIGMDSDVMSGGSASVTWSGLSGNTQYEWYVVADDSTSQTMSMTWTFTTEAVNEPPNQPMNPSPGDGMTDVSTSPSLSVDVSDPDGDSMNVTFYDASDDSMIGMDSDVVSGGSASVTWSGLSEGTTYEWYTISHDGVNETRSPTWSFTTEEAPNEPPNEPTNPSIPDGKKKVGTNPTLSIDVSDPDGGSLTATFYDASDDSVIGTDTVQSGGTASVTWEDLKKGKTYRWYVEVSDGEDTTTSDTFSFKTKEKDEGMFLGLSDTMGYALIGILLLVVLAIIIFAVTRRRRREEELEEEELEEEYIEEEEEYEPEEEEDLFAEPEEEEEDLFSEENEEELFSEEDEDLFDEEEEETS